MNLAMTLAQSDSRCHMQADLGWHFRLTPLGARLKLSILRKPTGLSWLLSGDLTR